MVFAHTVFALPFALIAFTLACQTTYVAHPWILLLQLLGCMVTARNSAMSFNRYVDRHIDALNERTKGRELPAGALAPKGVLLFFCINALLFILCSWSINRLCFYLSFPALVLLCGYSYTKRFTWLCHFVLGLALAIAPVGAFIAVTGIITLPIVWLSLMVALWVSGFDILYALSDEAHDRAHDLFSVPERFGRKTALLVSRGLHTLVLPMMVLFGLSARLSWGYWMATLIFTCLLIYQHSIVKVDDITKLNRAFFTVNGIASLLFAILTIADILEIFLLSLPL